MTAPSVTAMRETREPAMLHTETTPAIAFDDYEYRYNGALGVIEFRGGVYETTEWRESMYKPDKIRALYRLLPAPRAPETESQ